MLVEENFIDFTCPWCGADVSFPGESAGHLQICPQCNQDLVVAKTGGEPGTKPPLPIVTPRLNLRRLEPGDWKDLMECNEEPDEERIQAWVERDPFVRLTSPDQPFFLGMVLTDGGKLIGCLSLRITDVERLQAEADYEVNEAYLGKDLEQEAIDGLLGFCFKGIGLHRVTARVLGGADAECRIFEQVGMRREGEFVKDRRVNGEWVNTICFAALAEDYEAGDAPPAEDKP